MVHHGKSLLDEYSLIFVCCQRSSAKCKIHLELSIHIPYPLPWIFLLPRWDMDSFLGGFFLPSKLIPSETNKNQQMDQSILYRYFRQHLWKDQVLLFHQFFVASMASRASLSMSCQGNSDRFQGKTKTCGGEIWLSSSQWSNGSYGWWFFKLLGSSKLKIMKVQNMLGIHNSMNKT